MPFDFLFVIFVFFMFLIVFQVFWVREPSQVVDLAESFKTVASGPPEASAIKSSDLW